MLHVLTVEEQITVLRAIASVTRALSNDELREILVLMREAKESGYAPSVARKASKLIRETVTKHEHRVKGTLPVGLVFKLNNVANLSRDECGCVADYFGYVLLSTLSEDAALAVK